MKINLRDAAGISIGIEIVVSVLIGLGGGYWLDKKFGTAPWLMILGIVLGFAAGIRSMLRTYRKSERRDRGGESGPKLPPPSAPPSS